jgi:GTPase SAR1 family protein
LTADPRRKLDVPPEWGAAASEIFVRSLRTVLVIGGSAVGKSSFCRYLTEVLLARQAEVAFVDADIGQSNIGPPATVTLGYPVAPINFPTVPPAAYYYVGNDSRVITMSNGSLVDLSAYMQQAVKRRIEMRQSVAARLFVRKAD